MVKIDCRGKACPQPVIMTKEALDQLKEGQLTIVVDDPSACDNVKRFVQSQGCSVELEKGEGEFYLHIQKGKVKLPARPAIGRTGHLPVNEETKSLHREEKPRKVVVYMNSHLLGVGDEALGSILMKSFLKTLLDLETRPSHLILINSGVQLATEGSEVLETLRRLSEKGVEILSCGTCLDFYGLKGKLRVGMISNMYDIAQSLLEADCLVRP